MVVVDEIYTDTIESKERLDKIVPSTTKVIVINGFRSIGTMAAETTLMCNEVKTEPESYTKFNSYKKRKKGRS